MSGKQIPIIFDAATFIQEQYKKLSPNWNMLTGKEQLKILTKRMQPTQKTHPGEPEEHHGDEKEVALRLSKMFIFTESCYNPAVAALLGINE